MPDETSENNIDAAVAQQGVKLLYLYSAQYKEWENAVTKVVGRQPKTGIYSHVRLIDAYLKRFPQIVSSCQEIGLDKLAAELTAAINHGQDRHS